MFLKRPKIEIKYFKKDLLPIEKIEKGDWIDLRAAETVKLKKGDYYALKLGVGMILPKGYEGIIAPRSSTFKQYKIICPNSFAVMDNSYNGDDDQWHFLVYALENTKIPEGERICQFRIQKTMGNPKFKVVQKLKEKSRGGIGTTGVK